jgi:hypothetical protein
MAAIGKKYIKGQMSPDTVIKNMYKDVDKAMNPQKGFALSDIARVTLPAEAAGRIGNNKNPAQTLKDYLFKPPAPQPEQKPAPEPEPEPEKKPARDRYSKRKRREE